MKNIERLLREGDIDKLEKARRDALAGQDAIAYARISSEMGMSEKSVEDATLYERGMLESQKKSDSFWGVWNAAKKVPEIDRLYQPGRDFAYVKTGKDAKKALAGMFPNEAVDIGGLSAKQVKRAYYDIRSVYFGLTK